MPAASKTNRQLFRTTWPFVAVVASLLALVATSLSIMSSVRAYIGGESTWSKGQKDAVFYLIRYAQTGDEQAYSQYESAIAFPLNLKRARLALDRPQPDDNAARDALLESGVYPADVGAVIWVFRTFRRASYFEEAVAYWTRGDALVDQLAAAARQLRAAKAAGPSAAIEVEHLTGEVWNINASIAPISRAFADVLGAAFRQTAMLLFVINVVVAMLLVSLSVWYARRFITARLATEHALRRSEARAKATLGSIGEAVISVGPTGLVEFINPVAERLFCRDAATCVNRPLTALVSIVREWDRRPIDLIEQALRADPADPPDSCADLVLTNVQGGETVVQAITSLVHDTSDTITGVVLLLRNMAREREYVSNLAWQASHDGLTGLFNRTEFERRLFASLDTHAQTQENDLRPSRPCMLMMLDLDQFKVVNDTYGHAAGDTMLREVAALIKKCLRDEDSLARLGGDEFAALMPDCDEQHALQIAECLRAEVAAFEWSCETHTLSTSVSIGLVDLRGLDMETAMRFGDIACYLAKERGRDRVHLAVRGDKELTRHASAMSWCGRIKDALANNRFCLYAQDIRPMHPHSAHPHHVEVLLRMVGEGGKIISPNFFMPAAERYGLMSAIDRWVVRAVFATLARTGNPEGTQYAINLSGASIGDERFLQFLTTLFETSGVAPESICFEVTETTAVANLAAAARFIRELKKRGCKFSLDDFGAGMSSFGYLKHLPVDYIKIDGGFIKDMLKDAVNRDMVAAINDIGHSMGRLTIAEYVESEAILRALDTMGVDFVQGFHVGRPALWAQNVEFLAIT
jgi:diguanylate cyclase (GGDEF)-like protein